MSELTSALFRDPIWELPIRVLTPIGWAVLHSLWLVGLCALGYLGVRALTNSPSLRYAAALIALALAVLTPAALAWRLAEEGERILGESARPAATATAELDAARESAPGELTPLAARSRLERFLPTIARAWLLGVLLLWARLALGAWQADRLIRRGSTLPGAALERRLRELALRIGATNRLRLRTSGRIDVPCVVGWLRPTVLVPFSTLTALPPNQLEAVLLHELAHVRRHDYLINFLQTAAATLLFYHPLAHWLSREIRQEREHCCDALAAAAIGSSTDYADALACLERSRRASPPRLAAAADAGDLRRRIERLLTSGTQVRANNHAGHLVARPSVLIASAPLVLGALTLAASWAVPVIAAQRGAASEIEVRAAAVPPKEPAPVRFDLRIYELDSTLLERLDVDWLEVRADERVPGSNFRRGRAILKDLHEQLEALGSSPIATPTVGAEMDEPALLRVGTSGEGHTSELAIQLSAKQFDLDTSELGLIHAWSSASEPANPIAWHWRRAIELEHGDVFYAPLAATYAQLLTVAVSHQTHLGAMPARPSWSGELVDISLEQASLFEAIVAFSRQFSFTFTLEGIDEHERDRRVDAKLEQVPWDFALQYLINRSCLSVRREGSHWTIHSGPQEGPRAGDPVPCTSG